MRVEPSCMPLQRTSRRTAFALAARSLSYPPDRCGAFRRAAACEESQPRRRHALIAAFECGRRPKRCPSPSFRFVARNTEPAAH